MVREIKGNLLDDKYKYIAIGVTSDLSMGAGVALAVNEKFNIKNNDTVIKALGGKKRVQYPSVLTVTDESTGTTIFNLVNKKDRYEKLTYQNIYNCIDMLKEEAVKNNIPYIVMPRIGCGMDKLEWDLVKEYIVKSFKDVKTNVMILHI